MAHVNCDDVACQRMESSYSRNQPRQAHAQEVGSMLVTSSGVTFPHVPSSSTVTALLVLPRQGLAARKLLTGESLYGGSAVRYQCTRQISSGQPSVLRRDAFPRSDATISPEAWSDCFLPAGLPYPVQQIHARVRAASYPAHSTLRIWVGFSSGALCVMDPEDHHFQPVHGFEHPDHCAFIALALADGHVVGVTEGSICVFNVQDPSLVHVMSLPEISPGGRNCVACKLRQTYLACRGGSIYVIDHVVSPSLACFVRSMIVMDGKMLHKLIPPETCSHSGTAFCVRKTDVMYLGLRRIQPLRMRLPVRPVSFNRLLHFLYSSLLGIASSGLQ
eukprot:gene1528-440_t